MTYDFISRAKVVKKDSSHKNSVILSFFEDDNSVHWAPADDVREWLAMHGDGNCTGKFSCRFSLQFWQQEMNTYKTAFLLF